jgi:hypothetical protein
MKGILISSLALAVVVWADATPVRGAQQVEPSPHTSTKQNSAIASAKPPSPTTRLDTLHDRSALKTDLWRTPCFSGYILGTANIDELDVLNRFELRLRTAGLQPVPKNKCNLPEYDAPVATAQQMKTVWLSIQPFFKDDGTLDVRLSIAES